MNGLLAYSGVAAKVRGMKRQLLTQNAYRELSLLTNVQEAITYLKGQPGYQDVLSAIDERNYHREEAEKLLTSALYRDFAKIYLFCSLNQRKYLKLYFIRYEVDFLKSCLRSLLNPMKQENGNTFLTLPIYREFYQKFSSLDIEKLSTSQTAAEFIQNLQGTRYYKVLAKLNAMPDPALFDYAMALDLFYFSTLWKDKNKVLSKQDLRIITQDLGAKIDLLNVMWIYRSKKYYQMSQAEIYALLIPIRYKLKRNEITALVEAPTVDDMVNHLGSTYYARFHEQFSGETAEETYIQLRNKLHAHQILKNPYSMAAIHAYLFWKEREIDILTTVLECIRYRTSPAEIMAYVNKLGGSPS